MIIMAMFCNLSITATASRQLFAFARDQGVPYARFFAYVRPGWDVPMNSIIVSFVVSCLLALINIGSTIALNNITSLSLCAILYVPFTSFPHPLPRTQRLTIHHIRSSYIISISLLLWRRLFNLPLLPAPFTLSKPVGILLNVWSLAFLWIAFIFSFFPGTYNPTVAQMNWACLIYGAVMIFALVHYYMPGGARNVYDGPVEYVRKL